MFRAGMWAFSCTRRSGEQNARKINDQRIMIRTETARAVAALLHVRSVFSATQESAQLFSNRAERDEYAVFEAQQTREGAVTLVAPQVENARLAACSEHPMTCARRFTASGKNAVLSVTQLDQRARAGQAVVGDDEAGWPAPNGRHGS